MHQVHAAVAQINGHRVAECGGGPGQAGDAFMPFEQAGKALKLAKGKLWLDSRDFVYLNSERICTMDFQRKDWGSGKQVILKWEHSSDEHETAINLLALAVLRSPAWG